MIAGTHIPAMEDVPRKSAWCNASNVTPNAAPPATYLPVRLRSS